MKKILSIILTVICIASIYLLLNKDKIENRVEDKIKNKTELFVKFRDYAFFVPKSGVEGEKIVVEGIFNIDTTSIQELRHYAEDAGESYEDIQKINSSEIEYIMIANAVKIKDDRVWQNYGDTLSNAPVIAHYDLLSNLLEFQGKEIKIIGTVESTCSKKGCWVKVLLSK